MKEVFLYFLGLVTAFMLLLFVSCDDKSVNDNGVVTCTISATATDGGSASIDNYSGNTVVLLAGNTLVLVADPAEGYQFVGWYIYNSETLVSKDLIYSFIASKDVAYVAKFEKCFAVSLRTVGNGIVALKDISDTSLDVLKGSEVTVVATPDGDSDFLGWFIGDGKEPISTEAVYTLTVTENVVLVAKFKAPLEPVDLGLPSGLKWANYNVGAISPEDYGGYYAWGETEEKSDYSWFTYKHCNGNFNMTKYCTDGYYGIVDNKTVLEFEDDVAHVKWGGDWRMPTKEEQEELRDNCKWLWTNRNGVNGNKVIGPNGNSIFLPASGFRSRTDIFTKEEGGDYWSCSLQPHSNNYACSFYFGNCVYGSDIGDRVLGMSVRPVCE